jgi:hypothetical protein
VNVDVRTTRRHKRTVLVAAMTASLLALPACSGSPTPINAPLPTVTITITAGMTPSSALQSTPPVQSTGSAIPSGSDEVLIDVDPNLYRIGPPSEGYFFLSPSKNLWCGFITVSDGQVTGCQATVAVANLADCKALMVTSSPAI